ncbi:hypothetical protein [Amycolatopsis sp. H20-H5]|uniref:hypothetical protein n=1 Tax=Amycolatopsis sp. H20-H5 TaxID=3046309 RepID=UPI002DB9234E|nr:hypothetical protein [Amycolatopsis sp. H20-H5]MEC3975103.1 hypothetical protein [Amycolatopsis sp. H20-H5]
MSDSPWMDLQEAARFMRRHLRFVQQKCLEYDRSGGKTGLKNTQPTGEDGKRFVHVDDVNRWMERQPPSRGNRRFRVAS